MHVEDRDHNVPLASVVVVCRNAGHVLGRCLDQLVAQDYANYEIVVVDDASYDGTLQIAEQWLGRCRLTIVRSPLNRGASHARNLGTRCTKGEIIAFLDADGFAAPSWLRHLVAAFDGDETVGAAAATVFFAGNPLVVNGAGGAMNRGGWAGDLSLNMPYEHAEIPREALYPMGCGMAIRRSAAERVGPWDDRMLVYYEDVDYGIRLWRAGYRVVVTPDAWVDHGFGYSGRDPDRRVLLCEQYRIRVMLKHASVGTLAQWAVREALATRRARSPRHELRRAAVAWNARHLPSVVSSRWRARRDPRVPERLVDPSWGEGFPHGVPPGGRLAPKRASNAIDMADPSIEGQLPYGWFAIERLEGHSFRWAAVHASALLRLTAPAARLRLEYRLPPVDTGAVGVSVRCLSSSEPLAPAWSTSLIWQDGEWHVANYPISLAPGDYEVVFTARRPWSQPPQERRELGFALAGMSFEESYEVVADGLDMARAQSGDQLVSGWFELERVAGQSYRWATGHAAAVVRLQRRARSFHLNYRLPPAPIGGLTVCLRPASSRRVAWSTRIAWKDGGWHDDSFPVALAPGDYEVSFDTEVTWSNRGRRDASLGEEHRPLGLALSSLSFGDSAEVRR